MDNSPVPRPMPPALVLTAGLGTRLAPLTDVRAKPAVPVAGVPLVTRVLRWLAEQGVTSTVLNLHHRPETITRHVGHGSDVGLHVRYSWESTLLGTAGGARHALDLLGERFFIVNGDTLTDVDLGGLLDAHERADAAVTLAVSDNPGSITLRRSRGGRWQPRHGLHESGSAGRSLPRRPDRLRVRICPHWRTGSRPQRSGSSTTHSSRAEPERCLHIAWARWRSTTSARRPTITRRVSRSPPMNGIRRFPGARTAGCTRLQYSVERSSGTMCALTRGATSPTALSRTAFDCGQAPEPNGR